MPYQTRNDSPDAAELSRVCHAVSGQALVAADSNRHTVLNTDMRGDRVGSITEVRQKSFGAVLAAFIDTLGSMEVFDVIALMRKVMRTNRAPRFILRALPAKDMPDNTIAEVIKGGSPGELVFRSRGLGGYLPDDTVDASKREGKWPEFDSWVEHQSHVLEVNVIASNLTNAQMEALFAQPNNAFRAALAEHFEFENRVTRSHVQAGRNA